MITLQLTDAKGLLGDHRAVLREYARRVLLQGEPLTPYQEVDRDSRMWEFLALSSSFGLTPKEMVLQLLKPVLGMRPHCGCPTCRAREMGSLNSVG